MDVLIRSVALAETRTRLATGAVARVQPVRDDPAALRKQLRDEVERELRAEWLARDQEAARADRESARAEGYALGLEQGREAARAEAARLRAELDARLESGMSLLHQAHEAAMERLGTHVGALAFSALCKLVGHQAGTELFVRSVVEQVCARLRTETVAVARMHPRDAQLLGSLIEDARLSLGTLGLEIVADESLELGGCVVESSVGVYDGSLQTQLERLHAVLTGE